MIQFTNDESLSEVLNDDSAFVHFASKAEESAYERLDSRLVEQIRNTAEALQLEEGVYQIEDWWPNHLRGIESSPHYFRRDLLESFQRLLTGEFEPWRIVIHYYEGSSSEERGCALILSDRILATDSLKNHLK